MGTRRSCSSSVVGSVVAPAHLCFKCQGCRLLKSIYSMQRRQKHEKKEINFQILFRVKSDFMPFLLTWRIWTQGTENVQRAVKAIRAQQRSRTMGHHQWWQQGLNNLDITSPACSAPSRDQLPHRVSKPGFDMPGLATMPKG